MATPAQASTDPSLGFPPKGSLKRFPFPRLMREVARHNLTGSLYLLSGQTKKVVFFEEGQPVFVRSNVLAECLGQILASEGLITQEQCEQTLEAIRRTGKKQGELLVEMGILSEGNLRYGLEAQLRAKLFDIFSWEDGRYQFKPGPLHLPFGIRLSQSAEGVIIEAIQDQYAHKRAMDSLDGFRVKFPLRRQGADEAANALNLLPEERYFLDRLDGSRSVDDVLAKPQEPVPPSPAPLLFGLLQAGIAQLSDKSLPPADIGPGPVLGPGDQTDEQLSPAFTAQNVITEYEDTPLPGELPKPPGLLGDHEADFAGVEEDEPSRETPAIRPEVSEELVAAEPEAVVDETFDEDIVLLADDELAELAEIDELDDLEVVEADATVPPADGLSDQDLATVVGAVDEDLFLSDEDADSMLRESGGPEAVAVTTVGDALERDELAAGDEWAAPPTIGEGLAAAQPDEVVSEVDVDVEMSAPSIGKVDDDLMGFDELDAIDLGDPTAGPEVVAAGSGGYSGPEATMPEDDDRPEIVGAMRFNEAEMAMVEGDHPRTVLLLEQAYEHGFDVAELHAMLAYARFMAAGQDRETANHAFELLDYAESMDPSLDLVHAYRGAIYRAIDDTPRAREALERALELNPYCELAIQIMDSL